MTKTPAPDHPTHGTCETCDNPRTRSVLLLHPDDWLTPDEVVTHLRGALTTGTLRNHRSARKGPRYLLLGRSVFYPRAEVEAWLAEQVRRSEARWNDRD